MKILAIETAADPGSVALLIDGQVSVRICPEGLSNSASLLPEVLALLEEAHVGFADLDAIAFGKGPGSFTGLRVSCGVAQGLAVARETPLIAVGTLDAMAQATQCERVVVILDARMGEVYYAYFEAGILVSEVGVAHPDAVPLPDSAGWVACGNGLLAHPSLMDRLSDYVESWLPEIMPNAAGVAILAAQRFACSDVIDPADAVPFYVRNKVAKTIAERLAEGGKA